MQSKGNNPPHLSLHPPAESSILLGLPYEMMDEELLHNPAAHSTSKHINFLSPEMCSVTASKQC